LFSRCNNYNGGIDDALFSLYARMEPRKKILGSPNRSNKVLEGAKKGRKSILLENIYIEATFDYGGAMAPLTPL